MVMTDKYLLDRNIIITGDLIVNTLINVSENVSGIKNLSELIGKDEEYKGDLTLDTLVIFDKLNFQLTVKGNTTTMETLNLVALNLGK